MTNNNINSEDYSLVNLDESTDRYGVNYTQLIMPLINAVKELKTKNESLEVKNESLEVKNLLLEQQNQNLQSQMASVLARLDALENN